MGLAEFSHERLNDEPRVIRGRRTEHYASSLELTVAGEPARWVVLGIRHDDVAVRDSSTLGLS